MQSRASSLRVGHARRALNAIFAVAVAGNAAGCSSTVKSNPITRAESTKPGPAAIATATTIAHPDEAFGDAPFQRANSRLSAKMYSSVSPQSGNLVLAPASITTALAVTYAGADGETAAEIASALGIEVSSSELEASTERYWSETRFGSRKHGIDLEVASRLFTSSGIEFREAFLHPPGAASREVERVDFNNTAEAQRTINAWTSARTHGRISTPIRSPEQLRGVALALVNALYVRSVWTFPFNRAATTTEHFWSNEHYAVDVPMMHGKLLATYTETADAQWVALRVGAGASPADGLRFAIALPKKGGTLAIQAVERSHSVPPQTLLEPSSELVSVTLPRLDFRVRLDLIGALSELGIRSALTPDANLNRMTPHRIHVGAAFHEATIAIDELGLEASAATMVLSDLSSEVAHDRGHVIRADRAFLFWLLGTDGTILFRGRVVLPIHKHD